MNQTQREEVDESEEIATGYYDAGFEDGRKAGIEECIKIIEKNEIEEGVTYETELPEADVLFDLLHDTDIMRNSINSMLKHVVEEIKSPSQETPKD